MGINYTEYRSRQARVRVLIERSGYGVLLAWARGASTQDHAADVLYLTGHYTPQGFVPDTLQTEHAVWEHQRSGTEHWRWRAAGHAAVVIPLQGPTTLITDSAPRPDSPAVSDRLIVTSDIIAATGDILGECMRAYPKSKPIAPERNFRVALLGGEALAGRWQEALLERLRIEGEAEFIDADDISWELRVIKSPAEQDLLRAAGALGARAMTTAMQSAVVGATEADVVAACVAEVIRGGGAWYGAGLSSAEMAHSFAPTGGIYGTAPNTLRRLELGDLVRFDIYGSLSGYVFDFARSFVVGRRATPEQVVLLKAVRDSVQAGVNALLPGATLGCVARTCEAALANSEYARQHGTPASVMDGAWGHGLGLAFEWPWITSDSEVIVQPGMCFAVERRIEAPSQPPAVRGAQYEDNILVTCDGAELLTCGPEL